jgi:transposase-like protein
MEIELSGTPKRQFTHEYRAEAVKLVTEQGMPLTAAAQNLGLSVVRVNSFLVCATSVLA